VLFEDIKYFFYITNHTANSAEQIVALANGSCDQENVIEQLKNGVNAMRMSVDDLLSNWAYMVMSALAWNLKAWYGLLMPKGTRPGITSDGVPRFLHLIVMLPAQIVAQRSADYLSDHGLQRLAQRLLFYLGVSSPNGTCLK
jgi:hypothetical protein